MLELLRIIAFVVGAAIVVRTLSSAIQTFVLPRSANDRITNIVFRATWSLFRLRMKHVTAYKDRDRIAALYAPIGLLLLPAIWLTLVLVGYMLMFWAIGARSWEEAFRESGSSLLTLGFSVVDGFPSTLLAFSEAAIGLVLIALLIAYLPTMYSAFSRREAAVNMLEVRAGSPPSALEMMQRYHRIHGLNHLGDLWKAWELWFVDVEESHTSLAPINFFRSPHSDHSWVTAAGAVLDGAALSVSTLDIPHDAQADLCIRAGYLALRRIADFFRISYNAAPRPGDPISISKEEYMEVCAKLESSGISLKPDREQAWRDFQGWRVNYDTVLLALCVLTMAPEAPWSADRAYRYITLDRILHDDGRRPAPEPAPLSSLSPAPPASPLTSNLDE
ncbi:MAG TPA: hypothetical protein VM409_03645 [Chloroflexia bacterium]|nr:hypothetical protein [Chloroflexia bacterium]